MSKAKTTEPFKLAQKKNYSLVNKVKNLEQRHVNKTYKHKLCREQHLSKSFIIPKLKEHLHFYCKVDLTEVELNHAK